VFPPAVSGSALRHRRGLFRHFVDIACFKADIEKVMGHGLFDYFFISVVYTGKTDKITIFDFFDDIDEFNPVIPALYAVTFHHNDPPMGLPYISFGRKNRSLKPFLLLIRKRGSRLCLAFPLPALLRYSTGRLRVQAR
jgi:hypothetical protein